MIIPIVEELPLLPTISKARSNDTASISSVVWQV